MFSAPWVSLENKLSERSKVKLSAYEMISFTGNVRTGKLVAIESRSAVSS